MCVCCAVHQRQKRQALLLEQQKPDPDLQLNRLRFTNTTSTIMTEYNPNYGFGDGKYTIHDLHEVKRDRLSLVK